MSSLNNPADILSRGLEPSALASSRLWWHGPHFLTVSEDHWPDSNYQVKECDLPEQRIVVVTASIPQVLFTNDLLERFSNLNKICRILAYCLRLVKARRPESFSVFITVQEMRYAGSIMQGSTTM